MDRYFADRHHHELAAQVRDFAEREVRPRIAAMEENGGVDLPLSRRIARQGWIGATIPTEYGGMGAGHLAKTIIIEELARVSGAMGAMAQASQLGVAKILHFGNDVQKKTWLPAIASGDCLPTIAVTEPGSGGHVLGMEATAVRDGDDYILNGRKVYVGNSHVGDLHGCVFRTGGPGTKQSKSLSAFLVEADRPGFSLAPQEPTSGLNGFSFGELIFENCRVPAENMLGNEGDGLSVAYSSSTLYGRPNLTAVSLGIHRAIAEETAAFCEERVRYGDKLGNLNSIQIRLGRIQSRLMYARLAAYHAVHRLDNGESCDTELMNAKLVNYEAARDSARDALEIHAAAGLYKNRHNIERYQRDASCIYAPAGTSEVQLLRLGQVALGTAKGSWSERLSEIVRRERRPEPALV